MVSEQSTILAKPTTWDALYPTEEEIEELRKSMPASSKENTEHDQEEPGDMSFSPDIEIGHGDVIAGGTWTLEALHTPAISQIISVSATRKSKAYLLAITSWGGARQ